MQYKNQKIDNATFINNSKTFINNSLFHQSIKDVILAGCDIEIGLLSICTIKRNFHPYKIQVDHSGSSCYFSELYSFDDIDVAIDKFILLKNQVCKNNQYKSQNKHVRTN